MTSAFKGRLRKYTVYFLVWTEFRLYMFSQGMVQKFFSHDPNPWTYHLTSWMVGVYLWLLLTPAVLWLGRRFPFDRNYWMRRTAIHLVFSVMVAILNLAVESAILR